MDIYYFLMEQPCGLNNWNSGDYMPILIHDQNSIDSLGNKINTNDSLVFAPAMVLGSIITINLFFFHFIFC